MNVRTGLLLLSLVVLVQGLTIGVLLRGFLDARTVARRDDQATWRLVICTIDKSNPKLTPAQQQQVDRFWDHILVTDVHTTPCAPQ